jgi:hypothetical protein
MGFPEADVAAALRMTSTTDAALALLLGETPAVERPRGELGRGNRVSSSEQETWLETWEMMLGTPEDTERLLAEGAKLEVLAEVGPMGTVFHQLVEHEEPEHLEIFCDSDMALESMQDYTGFEDEEEYPTTINALLDRMQRCSMGWNNKASDKKRLWLCYASCLADVVRFQLRPPADIHLRELTPAQVAIVRLALQFEFAQRTKEKQKEKIRRLETEVEDLKEECMELQDENVSLIHMLHKAGIDYENSH